MTAKPSLQVSRIHPGSFLANFRPGSQPPQAPVNCLHDSACEIRDGKIETTGHPEIALGPPTAGAASGAASGTASASTGAACAASDGSDAGASGTEASSGTTMGAQHTSTAMGRSTWTPVDGPKIHKNPMAGVCVVVFFAENSWMTTWSCSTRGNDLCQSLGVHEPGKPGEKDGKNTNNMWTQRSGLANEFSHNLPYGWLQSYILSAQSVAK